MTSSFNATQLLLLLSPFAFLTDTPSPSCFIFPLLFSVCASLSSLHCELRLQPPSPLSSTYLPLHTLSLSFAPSLPGEWQAHKCSSDSGGGVSVTAIVALTGARLCLEANTASTSAAEPLSTWWETERKPEKEQDDCYHFITPYNMIHRLGSFPSPNNHHDYKAQSLCQLLTKDI